MQTVKAKITKQGKSRVIKIPKSLVKETGFGKKDIVIEAKKDEIVIRPAKHPRDGWEEQFLALGPDDCPLDPYIPTQFDLEEWEW